MERSIDQKKFITDLIGAVQKDILNEVSSFPPDWDRIELRQYIADRFAREIYEMEYARLRRYRHQQWKLEDQRRINASE
jgi:hypothetical protein